MNSINKTLAPIAYILVGLPGSGKSTWMRNTIANGEYVIVSTDDEIEQYARSIGSTYSEVFSDYIKTATSEMNRKFDSAKRNGENIIWDQTNMSANKRAGILQRLPKNYVKIAVVFQIDREELQTRLDKRAKDEGKFIPKSVIDSMEASFQMPTINEGFSEIIRI